MADGGAEDEGVLGDDGEMFAEFVAGAVADVEAADEDGALVGVVEAEEELGEGGFTGTGRADEGDLLAVGDFEGDVAENGGGLVVGEVDVEELDVAFARGLGFVADGVGGGGVGGEDGVEAVEAGLGRAAHSRNLEQCGDRPLKGDEVGEVGLDFADGNFVSAGGEGLVLEVAPGAGGAEEGEAEVGDGFGFHVFDVAEDVAAIGFEADLPDAGLEVFGDLVFHGVKFDIARTAEEVGDIAGDVGFGGLEVGLEGLDARADVEHEEDVGAHEEDEDAGEDPVPGADPEEGGEEDANGAGDGEGELLEVGLDGSEGEPKR